MLPTLLLAIIPALLQVDYEPMACYPSAYQHIIKIDPKQEKCLATAIYGESRGEPDMGQVAVAYVIMNRAVKKPVCDVVLAPKQFSIFNNNPSLRAAAMSAHLEPMQKNVIDEKGWQLAKDVAAVVIRKQMEDPTNGATHYLSPTVMAQKGYTYPKWSKIYKLKAIIEKHKFYKEAKL